MTALVLGAASCSGDLDFDKDWNLPADDGKIRFAIGDLQALTRGSVQYQVPQGLQSRGSLLDVQKGDSLWLHLAETDALAPGSRGVTPGATRELR